MTSAGIYVASKTKHAHIWRGLRALGYPIISTWIDEAGVGETEDFTDLAVRCVSEASSAAALVLFAESGDILKGALIEVGAALAAGVRVFSFAKSHSTETALKHHPLWVECASFEEAIESAKRAAKGGAA